MRMLFMLFNLAMLGLTLGAVALLVFWWSRGYDRAGGVPPGDDETPPE